MLCFFNFTYTVLSGIVFITSSALSTIPGPGPGPPQAWHHVLAITRDGPNFWHHCLTAPFFRNIDTLSQWCIWLFGTINTHCLLFLSLLAPYLVLPTGLVQLSLRLDLVRWLGAELCPLREQTPVFPHASLFTTRLVLGILLVGCLSPWMRPNSSAASASRARIY